MATLFSIFNRNKLYLILFAMLQNTDVSYRNSRPLKNYSLAERKKQSPLRIKTKSGSRSPGHDRINSSQLPRNQSYHRLSYQNYENQKYNFPSQPSIKNADLPIEDPDENKPNWISMRTGGQFSKFHQDDPRANTEEDYKKKRERVNKQIEDDRKLIDETKKANAPIYWQVDVSCSHFTRPPLEIQSPKILTSLTFLLYSTRRTTSTCAMFSNKDNKTNG